MKLRITERNRIGGRSAWDPHTQELCKSIPGASWSKRHEEWSWPLRMSTLHTLRMAFGDRLDPEPELIAWARREVARTKAIKRASKDTADPLRHIARISPKLHKAMNSRKYQKTAARFGATAGSFVLADEPGLGKTASALGALMEMGSWRGPILIIAPKVSLSSVWKAQILQWTNVRPERIVVVPEGAEARKRALADFEAIPGTKAKFLIVNPAMIRRDRKEFCRQCDAWANAKKQTEWPYTHDPQNHDVSREIRVDPFPELYAHHWSAVILDEAHESLAGYKPSNVAQVVQGLMDLPTSHRIALTGTPLRGSELRIWGYLVWIDPAKHNSYWDWVERYFHLEDGYYGREIGGLRIDARKAFEDELDRYMLRRTRLEVRSDLPRGQRIPIYVDMLPKQRKQYEEFKRLGETQLASGVLVGQGVLSELTRLRQLAFGVWDIDKSTEKVRLIPTLESPKLDALMEWLAQRGVTGDKHAFRLSGGFKYVVASQFTSVLDATAGRLRKEGVEYMRIDGSTSAKLRDEYQERFRSEFDGTRVLLLQTQTGGVAIELDAWCDEMAILDETFIADEMVQLEGRTNNRSGRVAPRSWYYFRTNNTVDITIQDRNNNQHDLQHRILDKRRGVEVALHLIRGEAL